MWRRIGVLSIDDGVERMYFNGMRTRRNLDYLGLSVDRVRRSRRGTIDKYD